MSASVDPAREVIDESLPPLPSFLRTRSIRATVSMNRNHFLFRLHPLLAAVTIVGAVLALLLALYGLNRWIAEGQVMGRVVVGDVEVGGLAESEVRAELAALEERLSTRPARFAIDGQPVTLNPMTAGLTLDIDFLTDRALAVGREGNAVFHILATVEIDLVGSADSSAIEAIFDNWDKEVIASPASLGAVVIENGEPTPVYPETGVGLDRLAAREIVEGALLALEPDNHDLPTRTIVPRLTDADIDAAVETARLLIGEAITLTYNGSSVVFSPEQLTAAYVAVTVAEGTPQIVHTFDPQVIDGYLTPVRGQFEDEPVDARFQIQGDGISIVPGRNGTRIDEEETAQKLLLAGQTSGRVGVLPVVEGAEPDVTTAELEALGISHLVSEFTTHHACCQDRVTNIQLMADTIDMAIVMPGEIFSINEFVGERTLEKGYLPAGTIIAGQLVDTVGGGVSQFATTMFNAVFWGGYQDIEHRPHSYWFSRYPEGIEATVNWRSPDLRFRNNTDNAILIDTRYTNTSITIRIFGDNDGRTVKGEQVSGRTRLDVARNGGPNARHIEGTVSDRFNVRAPGPPQYRPMPEFPVDRVVTVQSEDEGWSVTVTRRITIGGGLLFSEETWTVTYLPQRAIYEVHPCKVPGQEETCPTTTTTTIPEETTTTAEG
jgi:vancomycin resistance protein YoaR